MRVSGRQQSVEGERRSERGRLQTLHFLLLMTKRNPKLLLLMLPFYSEPDLVWARAG
jgi:hypothetical protein